MAPHQLLVLVIIIIIFIIIIIIMGWDVCLCVKGGQNIYGS